MVRSAMLDWFTGYVGYDASQMRLGAFFEVDADGGFVQRRSRWETAVGSYGSTLQVTRCAAPVAGPDELGMIGSASKLGYLCANPAAVLRISGNPTKFLQGHNVAGPSVSQLGPVLQAMARSFGEGLRPADADSPTLPAVHRGRVDVTTHVDLSTDAAVHHYLRHLAACGTSHRGRSMVSGETVYFQRGSKRWELVFYCKHCELKKHRPNVPPDLLAELMEWTWGHLRIELRLKRPELRHCGTLDEAIIWEFVNRLEVSQMAAKTEPDVKLRGPVKLALGAWYDGRDLAVTLAHATFYRYRRQILDATGIDVSLPRKEQDPEADRALIRLDELREREVKVGEASSRIQRSLFGAG